MADITGTKLFGTGDVLTSADTNRYLMRGVKVFADAAARDAAYGGAGEPDLEEGEVVYLEDDDVLVAYDGALWATIGPSSTPFAIFREEQAQNTGGGTLTANTWTKRVLNTTVVNGIAGCSISSSVITLANAGTYLVFALAPLFGAVNSHQLRFRNTSDSTTDIIGGTHRIGFSNGQNHATLWGVVTVSASKNFELQHIGGTPNTGDLSLGNAGNFLTEVYAQIQITKVA